MHFPAVDPDLLRVAVDRERRAGPQHDVGGLAGLDRADAIAQAERDEIARRYPKVSRRVGGYNLDIFCPQSERPYRDDGLPNLAHLLVGSEGTLAYTNRIKLKLASLPRARALGAVLELDSTGGVSLSVPAVPRTDPMEIEAP